MDNATKFCTISQLQLVHQAWRDAQHTLDRHDAMQNAQSSGVAQCTIIRRDAMHNHQA
jgi:hypothetical protein